jgi:FKBP-type peptidyl-prolyl cis-trans isomerase FkpA
MRVLLLFLPAVLLAQTTTPKPAPRTSTAPRSSTASRAAAPPALTTDDQKTLYALGLSVYQSLGPFNLSPSELAIVQRAMSDAAAGKPALQLNVWGPKIQPLAQQRAAQALEKEKAASQAYLAKAAAAPGAVPSPSGLIFRDLRPGTGPSPRPTDTVKVNYRGTLINGTEFDSSYARNEPAQFALNRVIPCWTEGLQKMRVGGKAQLVCPANIAYGEQGRPGIPGGATLIFEVELLEISGVPNPPAAH